jgi:hypothetical protein
MLTHHDKGKFEDIDPADYVRTMNFFAVNELNTTEAAMKIVSEETFVAYILIRLCL